MSRTTQMDPRDDRTSRDAQQKGELNVSATLRLNRETNFIELHHGTFDVLVDDESVATIEPNDTIETQVAPGRHTLRVRKGRYSSRHVAFDVRDGEVAEFRCHGANLWPIYVASIAVPTVGISLKHE
jgi:hypothetical protein